MFIKRIGVSLALFSLLGTVPELCLALPFAPAPQETKSQAGQNQPDVSVPDQHSGTTAVPASSQDRATALPDAPSAGQSAQPQSDSSQSRIGPPQRTTETPSGTAAARSPNVKGGAASKPAGAAIAPAKQRRRRSLLIKLGLLAGAGVAIGSVAVLSKGSPSTPPGSH
jgi:hypothetical protein